MKYAKLPPSINSFITEVVGIVLVLSMLIGGFSIFIKPAKATAQTTPELSPTATNSESFHQIYPAPIITKAVEVEDCPINPKFPAKVRQWCDLITFFANKRDLDPNFIASVIWQESGGDPLAYSQSGAVGLMQIMPRDGLAASFVCANGPCFGSRPTTKELQDPEFNIKYGARMLSDLHSREGTLRDALKAYGPANVGYYYADKVLGIYNKYSK